MSDRLPRAERIQAIAAHTPAHPCLSWQVNGVLLAHRRDADELTACGREGDLTVVVDPGIPNCPKCYRT